MQFELQIDDAKAKTWNCKPVYSKNPLLAHSWPDNADCFTVSETNMSAGTFLRYLCLQSISHSISIKAPPDVSFEYSNKEEDAAVFGRNFIDYIVQIARSSLQQPTANVLLKSP